MVDTSTRCVDIASTALLYLQNEFPQPRYIDVITRLAGELPIRDRDALTTIVNTFEAGKTYSLEEAARYYVAAFSLMEITIYSDWAQSGQDVTTYMDPQFDWLVTRGWAAPVDRTNIPQVEE
jgi:hypothetical protein